jgi:hypothetical protein
MSPEGGDVIAAAKILEHGDGVAGADEESAVETRPELVERTGNEGPMGGIEVGSVDESGFDDVDGQEDAAERSLGKRAVIFHPQVALEPDELHHSERLLGVGEDALPCGVDVSFSCFPDRAGDGGTCPIAR